MAVIQGARDSSPARRRHKRAFSHISSLDGVRAFAVLAVLFHHTLNTSLNDQARPRYADALSAFFRDGKFGVDLFFVLSGYLITTLLLKDRRKPSMYHDFYVKRAFRILPALFASLAVGYLAGYLDKVTLVLSLLFVSNYARMLRLETKGPYWTLAVEEQFYIAWPILIRRASFLTVHRVILGILIAEPILRFWFARHGHGTVYFTHVRADGLAWGAWLGSSTYYHRIYSSPERARGWWLRYGRWIIGAGALAFTLHLTAYHLGLLGDQTNTAILTVLPIFFTGVLGYLVTHPTASVSRLLSLRPIAFFGDISYGLYLIHMTVIDVYDRATGWFNHPIEPVPYFVRLGAICFFSVGIAAASLYFFERPLMKRRARYLLES